MAIHVSAGGDVRTLAAAIELSRNSGDKEIIIHSGEYDNTSVVLDERDSGMTIAADGDGAVLRGGVRLAGWVAEGELWRAVLPPECTAFVRTLEVNGRLAARSRYPEVGVLHHNSIFPVQWMSTSAGGWEIKPTHKQLTELIYDPADLPDGFCWDSAEVTVFHKWDETLNTVASNEGNTLTFTIPCGHPPGGFDVDTYVVWNTPFGVRPGMFRFDAAARTVYYHPLPGEDMQNAVVYVPVHDNIIALNGDIERLTIRGLAFGSTTTPLITGSFGAMNIPGAINSSGDLSDCRFENLTVKSTGGWAIRLNGDNKDVKIRGCTVTDVGGGGIMLRNGTNCAISDNTIERVGRVYPSAIGITAQGCAIERNTLRDLPYTGICFSGNAAVIADNRVSNAVNLLNDGAGIYATFGEGGIMRGNRVESIPQSGEPDSTRNGLYLDEQCKGWIVEGNVTIDCSSAMMNHMSKCNTLRNNVFAAFEGDLLLSFLRCEEYTLINNTFHSGGTVTLAGRQGALAAFDNNLVFSADTVRQVIVGDDYKRAALAPLEALPFSGE